LAYQPAVLFVLGVLVGVLINSAYRAMRIERIKQEFESSLQKLDARKEPTVAPAMWGDELARGLEHRRGRGRVLVVEDLEPLCYSLTAILQSNGMAAEGAVSVDEARGQFEREGFDLVVIDATLGDYSGIELAREWLAKSPALKAVLMSGYPIRPEELGLKGDVKFLAKPFSTNKLLEVIDTLLQKKAA
jgi:CheY-like chemotaxis protein